MGGTERYNLPIWHFHFGCASVTFWAICPADSDPSYWGPCWDFWVGLLETIFMEHNSGPHLPPHRNLLPSLMYLKHLRQCLEHSECSINICWIDGPGDWDDGDIPPVLEAGTPELWAALPPLGTEGQGKEETKETGRQIWRVRIWAGSHWFSSPATRPFQGQAANHSHWIHSFVRAYTGSRVLAQGT